MTVLNTTTSTKVSRFKLVVVGECGVGKTAICQVFTKDVSAFPKNYTLTTGVDVYSKTLSLQGGAIVEVFLLDSSGANLYRGLVQRSWPNQSALLCLVFDVTNRKSFDRLTEWFERASGAPFYNKTMPGLLLGNKADLSSRRFVMESVAQEFAKKHQLIYYECSAKENRSSGVVADNMGLSVQDSFKALAAEWLKKTQI